MKKKKKNQEQKQKTREKKIGKVISNDFIKIYRSI